MGGRPCVFFFIFNSRRLTITRHRIGAGGADRLSASPPSVNRPSIHPHTRGAPRANSAAVAAAVARPSNRSRPRPRHPPGTLPVCSTGTQPGTSTTALGGWRAVGCGALLPRAPAEGPCTRISLGPFSTLNLKTRVREFRREFGVRGRGDEEKKFLVGAAGVDSGQVRRRGRAATKKFLLAGVDCICKLFVSGGALSPSCIHLYFDCS
jgi:hypothetical protein